MQQLGYTLPFVTTAHHYPCSEQGFSLDEWESQSAQKLSTQVQLCNMLTTYDNYQIVNAVEKKAKCYGKRKGRSLRDCSPGQAPEPQSCCGAS